MHYHQLPQPGCTLQLQADIERCDAEAVAYSGKAFIDGRLALELVDSVGPMLPMEEFDAPEAVRADFHTLLGVGAAPGRFGGVPVPELHDLQGQSGERLGADASGARSRTPRPTSPITSRAGRCSPARC